MILLRISFFNKDCLRKIYNYRIIFNIFIDEKLNSYRLL